MFLNNILFLTSISKYIYYRVVSVVDNVMYLSLELEIKNMLRFHTVQGFHIIIIILNAQFKVLKERNLVSIPFNIPSKKEYINNIEKLHRKKNIMHATIV